MKTAVFLAALALAPAALADPIAADTAAPVVSGLHVTSARSLTFWVSEYALVHVSIRQRGADGGMHRIEQVERAFMPGAGRIAIRGGSGRSLPRGAYSAAVSANDAAHNYSPAQVVRFRVG